MDSQKPVKASDLEETSSSEWNSILEPETVESAPGPNSGTHKEVVDGRIPGTVEKTTHDGTTRSEAEEDIDTYSNLDVPWTDVFSEGGSYRIVQEKADMSHLEDGGIPEYLSVLNWVDRALQTEGFLYGDPKPQNFGRFQEGMRPIDFVGDEYSIEQPEPDDIESLYDWMIDQFSECYDIDRETLRTATERFSPAYQSF